jgi:hypothetical protein
MTDDVKLAVSRAVMETLTSIGIERFRQTSFFISNRRLAEGELKAA